MAAFWGRSRSRTTRSGADAPVARPPATSENAASRSLVLNRVTKRFESFVAVDDLSLTVPGGSFFALLGPSGCGKTTTLRMVAGLELPDAGSISIGPDDITLADPHRRPVNTVFQSYALFPHLDILENVAFGLRRRRVRGAEALAMQALDMVELAHVARRRPHQLSGGQQQRIALARAVVNEPDVLLLDEPLGALDLKLRRQMQVELKRIQASLGLTFVHVTHDQEEAMTMADTVAVMNQGRIEQMGAPAELYELPHTAFVANFLGQSNLMRGRIVGRELSLTTVGQHDLVVRVQGATVRVPEERSVVTSGEIVVGVRPEKARLVREGETVAAQENAIVSGNLIDASFAGVSTQYMVAFEDLGTMTVFSQNLDGHVLRPGAATSVAWAAQHTFGLAPDQDLRAGITEATGEQAELLREQLDLDGASDAVGS
ncbi:ABC transporter ATP-binding protein [Micrococcales bacterium 31B]|nr:ABC transporter ATP-binding protein [Micrococcales bacterium 31B]